MAALLCSRRPPLSTARWWTVKVQALTQQAYIDDLDLEEEGIAELLLDDNSIQKTPRPGTSIRPPTSSALSSSSSSSDASASARPMTNGGRPLSGFARPGTQSKGGRGDGSVDAAFKGGRPGTSRPMSVAGRFVRLGTQSLLSDNGAFIQVDRIDPSKFTSKPAEAKALLDFLLTVEHNPRKALDLASALTTAADFKDWTYKAKLGRCYYQLGLFRDAEKQLKSALAANAENTPLVLLELSKVYLRLDQPLTVIDLVQSAITNPKYSTDTSLHTTFARTWDHLGNEVKALDAYKVILTLDAGHVESIAQLATHHFYSDQPEIALRYYRRLVQMGVNNCEIWNNLGLCCFYASQYDMCLSCFDRALQYADDTNGGDVWYNIGQVGVGIGDLNLAAQSFKVAISIDHSHAESYNNLGILELRKNNLEASKGFFKTASTLAPHLFEPFFNGALVALKMGDCQESWDLVQKARQAYPGHQESQELLKQLKKQFTM